MEDYFSVEYWKFDIMVQNTKVSVSKKFIFRTKLKLEFQAWKDKTSITTPWPLSAPTPLINLKELFDCFTQVHLQEMIDVIRQ